MSNGTPSVLGVPLDAKHLALAIGGGAALVALGPAVLALPIVAGAADVLGVTLGTGGLAALGGYLAAKNLGDDSQPEVANLKK